MQLMINHHYHYYHYCYSILDIPLLLCYSRCAYYPSYKQWYFLDTRFHMTFFWFTSWLMICMLFSWFLPWLIIHMLCLCSFTWFIRYMIFRSVFPWRWYTGCYYILQYSQFIFQVSSGHACSSAVSTIIIHVIIIIILSCLYPFTERIAQSYFFYVSYGRYWRLGTGQESGLYESNLFGFLHFELYA